MKIVVCTKHVPDTETKPKIAPDGKSIVEADVNFVTSPNDEYALEAALQLKEKWSGEVIVVCKGDESAKKTLRQGLAVGADRAVHLLDPAFAPADPGLTAAVLAAAIKKIGDVDLILMGKQSVGDDHQQVGARVAELLDLPQVTVVTGLEIEDGKAIAHREIEGGEEIVETSLPLVITTQKGLNEPRYASLKGIMKAKKKPMETLNAADLGLDDLKPATSYLKLDYPPERQAGRKIELEPAEAARELVRLLHEEAKVI